MEGVSNAPPTVTEIGELADQLARAREGDGGHPELARQFRLRRFAGPMAHADALSHLRIVHLTDLHVGLMTPMDVQHTAVRITNAQQPDLVVITGDFVAHTQLYLDELTEIVSSIEAPVVCVLGNHDYWAGADEVRWALERGDAEILDNVHTTLTVRHERLQLLGLDDPYTGHASWRDAVKGLRPDLPTIGLSHVAEEADSLWAHGVPLVLSGHTHGGQVTVASLHELALGRVIGHRYVHGLYGSRQHVDGDHPGAVYVSAGVGAAVMPLRLGERGRREVAVFELGHQPGTFEEHHTEQTPLPGRKPSPRQLYKRHTKVIKKQQRRARRNGGGSILEQP